jgi:predicted hydrolase (HD superfamily)
LVLQGLVPRSLIDVFRPPTSKPLSTTRKRKVITEARVISGDDMLNQLREKDREEKKQKEELAARKVAQELKRKHKEDENQKKEEETT